MEGKFSAESVLETVRRIFASLFGFIMSWPFLVKAQI